MYLCLLQKLYFRFFIKVRVRAWISSFNRFVSSLKSTLLMILSYCLNSSSSVVSRSSVNPCFLDLASQSPIPYRHQKRHEQSEDILKEQLQYRCL